MSDIYTTKIYNYMEGASNLNYKVTLSTASASAAATSAVNAIGPVRMSLTGDFGGGTATLQAQDPDSSWTNVIGSGFSSAADALIDFPGWVSNTVRVNLTSTSAPNLVVWLQAGRSRT
jgi:hypothetical protein